MLRDHCVAMAGYNTWMNRRLFALAAELTDEERRRDLGAFFKSLHGTLVHILWGDRIWMSRFVGGTAVAPGEISFADLRRARETLDAEIETFAAGLDDAALSAPFAYKSLKGDPFEHTKWWAIVHMFNHQTHHRGQATTLFMQLGRDPGVTDLIAFLREQ